MKKIIAFTLFFIFIFVLAGCGSSNFLVRYEEFIDMSRQEFEMPGLLDDFIPQGVCEDNDTFYVSGYMGDKSASRVYLVKDNVLDKYVTLKKEDGSDYIGHAGGISIYEDYAYVASDGKLYVIKTEDIENAKNGESVKFVSSFATLFGSAYCFIKDDYIYVGEFYEKRDYKTDESHHIKTPDGKTNHSLCAVYQLDKDSPYGLKSDSPTFVISTPDKAQGFCITYSGKIVVSTSYGRKNDSYIYIYSSMEKADNGFEANGEIIDLYYLYGGNLEKKVKAISMTEGMDVYNNRVYVVTESASMKYKDTALFPQERAYSIFIM